MPKSEAGKLLSKYIAEIASEKIADDSMTKAEALARAIWKAALGYGETVTLKGGIEKIKKHAPSLSHQNIIIERMEGKAAQAEKPIKKTKKDDATSKISMELTKRINAINETDKE